MTAVPQTSWRVGRTKSPPPRSRTPGCQSILRNEPAPPLQPARRLTGTHPRRRPRPRQGGRSGSPKPSPRRPLRVPSARSRGQRKGEPARPFRARSAPACWHGRWYSVAGARSEAEGLDTVRRNAMDTHEVVANEFCDGHSSGVMAGPKLEALSRPRHALRGMKNVSEPSARASSAIVPSCKLGPASLHGRRNGLHAHHVVLPGRGSGHIDHVVARSVLAQQRGSPSTRKTRIRLRTPPGRPNAVSAERRETRCLRARLRVSPGSYSSGPRRPRRPVRERDARARAAGLPSRWKSWKTTATRIGRAPVRAPSRSCASARRRFPPMRPPERALEPASLAALAVAGPRSAGAMHR